MTRARRQFNPYSASNKVADARLNQACPNDKPGLVAVGHIVHTVLHKPPFIVTSNYLASGAPENLPCPLHQNPQDIAQLLKEQVLTFKHLQGQNLLCK